ncbi:FecCD family ABC transporter permease [Cohnella soli]|uniref:FecCD family ABC transporter permease n=1 Tax=Cohnella soli TaxID=425005 RepID=A0ABW0HKU6_9BACL
MNDPRKPKRVLLIGVLLALLAIAILLGLMIGAVPLSAKEVWTALFSGTESEARQIVWNLRFPRVLIGLLVGMSLAVAGSFMQGVFRNPLADPGIIGVSSGAGLAAVAVMILFPQHIAYLPPVAFLGALFATGVVYLLAWKGGAPTGRLILAGVAVNSLLGAGMTALMILNSEKVQSVLPWLSGTLNGRSWQHFDNLLPYAIVGLVASFFLTKQANQLILGDEVAKLLGNRVERSRLLVIVASTFLAGAAVSTVGMVGFVGLVVPHIARIFVGNNYRFLVPVSALGGASLVILSDTAARSWFDPIEFPVGILLAICGGPFFLYLLRGGMKGWKMS